MFRHPLLFCFFFFNDTATTEIYTLSLHDALPILRLDHSHPRRLPNGYLGGLWGLQDRKSTRLNSSHQIISYAVFCLKKKKNRYDDMPHRVGAASHSILDVYDIMATEC